MSDSLQCHGLQHSRLPCPSLSPRVCSNSCPSSRWCHPTISSSVNPFSSCLQSFPATGSFPVSQLFASGDQIMEFLHQSFQWVFRVDFLWDWLVWFPWSPRDYQESSLAPQLESRHFQISPRRRLNRGEDPSQAEAWGLLGKGSPQMSSVCLGHKCE